MCSKALEVIRERRKDPLFQLELQKLSRTTDALLEDAAKKAVLRLVELIDSHDQADSSSHFPPSSRLSLIPGDKILLVDGRGSFGLNALTLDRNGKPINGAASNYDCDVAGAVYTATFIDDTYGWLITF